MATVTLKLADVRTSTRVHQDSAGQQVKTEHTELTFHGVDAHGHIRTRLDIAVDAGDPLLELSFGDKATLTITAGVPVAAVKDQSGSGNDLAQADPAAQPTISPVATGAGSAAPRVDPLAQPQTPAVAAAVEAQVDPAVTNDSVVKSES